MTTLCAEQCQHTGCINVEGHRHNDSGHMMLAETFLFDSPSVAMKRVFALRPKGLSPRLQERLAGSSGPGRGSSSLDPSRLKSSPASRFHTRPAARGRHSHWVMWRNGSLRTPRRRDGGVGSKRRRRRHTSLVDMCGGGAGPARKTLLSVAPAG